MVAVNSTQDYLIYPNESVDKLTVNRPLSNLHALLKSLEDSGGTLNVDNADESRYGLVRRNTSDTYDFSSTGDENFSSSAMTIAALADFATRQYVSSDMVGIARTTDKRNPPERAIRLSLGSTKVVNMPNGNMMVVLSFDVGFDGLPAMFGEGVLDETPMPVKSLDGYGCYIVGDETTRVTLDDLYGKDEQGKNKPQPLSGLVEQANMPVYLFPVPVDGRVHFNACRWLSRSSYRQTRVEVKFQATVSVKGIFEGLYGYVDDRRYDKDGKLVGEPSQSCGTFPNRYAPFAHKPVVVAQVSSYTDGSRPPVLAGSPPDKEGDESNGGTFFAENVLTEKPLSSKTCADPSGGDPLSLPVVDGLVIPKNWHNTYRTNGRIDDNSLTLDVSMKFTAGGPDDPDASRAKRTCSGKASVDVVMIGVRDEG